jgi:hypothetical protein
MTIARFSGNTGENCSRQNTRICGIAADIRGIKAVKVMSARNISLKKTHSWQPSPTPSFINVINSSWQETVPKLGMGSHRHPRRARRFAGHQRGSRCVEAIMDTQNTTRSRARRRNMGDNRQKSGRCFTGCSGVGPLNIQEA